MSGARAIQTRRARPAPSLCHSASRCKRNCTRACNSKRVGWLVLPRRIATRAVNRIPSPWAIAIHGCRNLGSWPRLVLWAVNRPKTHLVNVDGLRWTYVSRSRPDDQRSREQNERPREFRQFRSSSAFRYPVQCVCPRTPWLPVDARFPNANVPAPRPKLTRCLFSRS